MKGIKHQIKVRIPFQEIEEGHIAKEEINLEAELNYQKLCRIIVPMNIIKY